MQSVYNPASFIFVAVSIAKKMRWQDDTVLGVPGGLVISAC